MEGVGGVHVEGFVGGEKDPLAGIETHADHQRGVPVVFLTDLPELHQPLMLHLGFGQMHRDLDGVPGGGVAKGGDFVDNDGAFAFAVLDFAGQNHRQIVSEVGAVRAQGFLIQQGLDVTGEALEFKGGHFGFAFGEKPPPFGDESGDAHRLTGLEFRNFLQGVFAVGFDFPLELLQRMPGDVEAEEIFFVGEHFAGGPGGAFGEFVVPGGGFRATGSAAEEIKEAGLPLFSVGPGAFAALHGEVESVEHAGAGDIGPVEGPGFDEGFDTAFVDFTGVDAHAEVHEAFEGAFGGAFGHDGVDGGAADTFDPGHAEADVAVFRAEAVHGLLHAGRKHLHAHFFAFADEPGEFVGVADFQRKHRRHEFGGVVGFEVGGLKGNKRVGGGVGFVEPVAGEFLNQIENFPGLVPGDLVDRFAAVNELRPHFVHDGGIFFAHGAAEKVTLGEGEAGKNIGGFLDLLLIDKHSVGFLEHALQQRVGIVEGEGAVFALDVVRDHVHGTGTVERDEGDDILDAVGLELTQQVAHAAGLHLEHGHGVAAVEEFEGLGVVERNGLRVDGDPVEFLDQIDGLLDDGEGFEPEEVHFQQPGHFQGLHFVLGHGLSLFIAAERDNVHEHGVADDDPGGVGALVALQAFEHFGVGHDLLGVGIVLEGLLELGVGVLGFGEGHAGLFGNHLGEFVAVAQGDFEDAADVADDGFGSKSAEGDDLGALLGAVFAFDVFDDFAAAGLTEVDVEVGRRYAVGVEEAFEDEVEAEGVDGGDAESVGDETAGAGAASGTNGNILGAGVIDEVPDDEEVVDESGAFDDPKFFVEAGLEGLFQFTFGVGDLRSIIEFFEAFD